MSPKCLIIAFLVLFGCNCDPSTRAMDEVVLADALSVDASFLSALEWRFVGPFLQFKDSLSASVIRHIN